jgi:crossover junction endodeoxyribonuclease RuvC
MTPRGTDARRIVLGVDPGTASMGVAIVARDGGSYTSMHYDCITTKPSMRFPERLRVLNRAIAGLIRKYKPEAMAMERLFFTKNARTAIAVGQAQGAILLATAGLPLDLAQYTPNEVKISVTGDGRADKDSVAFMVQKLLALDEIPRPDDAADALAIAYCHLVSTRGPGGRG